MSDSLSQSIARAAAELYERGASVAEIADMEQRVRRLARRRSPTPLTVDIGRGLVLKLPAAAPTAGSATRGREVRA